MLLAHWLLQLPQWTAMPLWIGSTVMKPVRNLSFSCSSATTYWNPKFTGDLRRYQFTKCGVQFVDTNRCKHDGYGDTVSENGGYRRIV